jgi:hypothetical protein
VTAAGSWRTRRLGARVGAARHTHGEDALISRYSGHPVEEAGERVWSRLRAGSDPAAAATLVPLCGCWMWQPRHRVVVFCASPVEFTAEAAGGRLRLHRADGAGGALALSSANYRRQSHHCDWSRCLAAGV